MFPPAVEFGFADADLFTIIFRLLVSPNDNAVNTAKTASNSSKMRLLEETFGYLLLLFVVSWESNVQLFTVVHGLDDTVNTQKHRRM